MPENLTLRDVKIYVKFETAATKQALVSNDTLPVLMGKINKWYNLLDEIAWTGHPTYIVTPTTSSVTPAEGDTFTAIDSLTVTNGHVTGYNTKTVTMPKSNIQDINYDSTTNELTITYSNESEETVPVGGSTYVAGDGISINDGASSFELSEDTVTNTVYLFDTQVTSSVSGRIYTKYNTEPALGAVVYYGYTQPFFVGLTADSVKYGTNYDSHIWPDPDHPPFEYKGVTWYYSGNAYGMPGDVTDSSGHMQKLPGNYSVATEEDLQNIARAIIDAADIIMSPSKTISAKLGSGLQFDSNNAIELDKATTETIGGVIVGDGLNIDANGVLSIDSSSSTGEYEAGDAIRFTKHTPEVLPAEYQLVDYIQSTGEQGIELNYIPASSYIKYELTFSDIEFVVNDDFHYLIGGWASAVDMRPPSIAYNFVLWPNKVDVPCGRTDTITNGEVPSDMTVPHTYTLTVSNGSISLQLDNGVVRTSSYSGNISQKVGLFCAPSNVAGDPSAIFQTAAYRFRELKIYEGNSSSNLTLIHHYYPCYRISDDEPGIYDVITDTFLTNIGTGDLIIGPITGVPAINVQYGEGLEVDNNNDLNVKLGDGLYFDADGAIAASGDNDYTAGEGIDITGTTRPIDINYIRLDINNSRDNGSGCIIQFRNIRVLDTNSNSLQFSHASSIYGDGSVVEYGQNTRDESPQAMIEGRNKTCCTNFSLSKAPLKITFTLTSEISIANITAFSILTGADHAERDPVSWDIYASNDGVTWYKIQEAHSPDVTTARSTWITNIPFVIPPDAVEILPGAKTIKAKIGEGLSFDSNDAIQNEGLLSVTQDFDDKNRLTFGTTYGDIIIDIPTGGGGDSSETYVAGDAVSLHNSTAPLTAPLTHFKWEISQTRAKAEGTVYVTLQVDEIEFYDENDQLITFSAIAGSFKSNSPNPPSPSYATTPTVQTPDKIIDNDITTKCCVTNFTSELDAMVFIFELDSTNPITAQDIKCYRYYTADNDTSADPVTWTLSVSPDGIEWFVVDTQTEFNAPTARETSTDYFTMTKPTIPAKSINVKYDDGLMLDAHGDLVVQTGKGIEISDNAVTAKLGVGLTFDNIDAITLDETIDLALNCDYSQ